MRDVLEQAVALGKTHTHEGAVATYIPELGKVDGSQLGVSVFCRNGKRISVGDTKVRFSIQSISKIITLAVALEICGFDQVFKKVGMEPTGDPFNSLMKLENTDSSPYNPMINAGAIVVASCLASEISFDTMLDTIRALCMDPDINLDKKVYHSEMSHISRNRAIAYLLESKGYIEKNKDVENSLHFYVKMCSLSVTAESLAGLGLILAGANFLTDGSAAVAQRFRVPEFIIGLTIVAVGTSMPELVVSVLSAAAGNSDVAIGNVVGSNIFNVFVILGICALIRPLVLTKENIRRDIPFGMAASLVLLAVTSDRLVCAGATDRIGRPDGIVMLALYIGLMWYMIRTTKRQRSMPGAATGMTVPVSGAALKNGAQHAEGTKKPMALWLAGVMIAGGLAGLIFGGEMFLKSATAIARTLGISESVIAITLVAGGTSLPELASSVVSLLKGKAEMALGNVIGSNIANILLILGISATIHPLTMGGITLTDILVVVLSSLLLFMAAFTFRSKKLDRWEGAIFLAIYIAYIWYLIR